VPNRPNSASLGNSLKKSHFSFWNKMKQIGWIYGNRSTQQKKNQLIQRFVRGDMVLSLLLRRCIFGLAFSYVHLVQMRQCRRQQQLADPVNDGIPKGYGKWRNGNFQKAKSKYPRFKCSVKCGSRTRRFCTCDPSTILCEKCFSCHFAEVFGTGPNLAS